MGEEEYQITTNAVWKGIQEFEIHPANRSFLPIKLSDYIPNNPAGALETMEEITLVGKWCNQKCGSSKLNVKYILLQIAE